MEKPDWTKLPDQLDVPTQRGLADILVRLSYLEAMIQTIAETVIVSSESDPKEINALEHVFQDKFKSRFTKLTEELISHYHRSDAPDERAHLQT
jgi:hypothetical protein